MTTELVRHLRLVAPLGGNRPFPQIPAHRATYGQPGASWMAWYVRAVERTLGLPSCVVNKAHLKACLAHLNDVVSGQIRYHDLTAGRCHRIEKRLHSWGIAFLALTLVACVLHLLSGVWPVFHTPNWLSPRLLTFACAFFPALGAALAGINNQAEFRRTSKRSNAMREQLELLQNQVEDLRKRIDGTPDSVRRQYSVQAVALAGDVARLLVNDVLDWRVVFLDRPLEPPA